MHLKSGIINTGTAFLLKLGQNETVSIFKLQCNQEQLLSLLNVHSFREECVRRAGVTHTRRQSPTVLEVRMLQKNEEKHAFGRWKDTPTICARRIPCLGTGTVLSLYPASHSKGSWNLQLRQFDRFSGPDLVRVKGRIKKMGWPKV